MPAAPVVPAEPVAPPEDVEPPLAPARLEEPPEPVLCSVVPPPEQPHVKSVLARINPQRPFMPTSTSTRSSAETGNWLNFPTGRRLVGEFPSQSQGPSRNSSHAPAPPTDRRPSAVVPGWLATDHLRRRRGTDACARLKHAETIAVRLPLRASSARSLSRAWPWQRPGPASAIRSFLFFFFLCF